MIKHIKWLINQIRIQNALKGMTTCLSFSALILCETHSPRGAEPYPDLRLEMNAASMPKLFAIDRPEHNQLIAKIESLYNSEPDHSIGAIQLGFSHHGEK